jgi:hypothetical protein
VRGLSECLRNTLARVKAGDGPKWLLQAFGARIAFADELGVHDAILRALPGARIDRLDPTPQSALPDVVYRVEQTRDPLSSRALRGETEIASGQPDVVLRKVINSLHFDIALHAREASFLHASVVLWEGRLLVFPGRSRSGKSTLAAFFAEGGATYYSDEYAPVDAEGRILSYPKPISLRSDMSARFGSSDAASPAPPAAPPHAVVFTSFRENATFDPQPVTVETAALSLVDNSVVAGPRPRQAAEAVARLLAHRPRLAEGARGEAAEFAAELSRWLAARS